jgi:hypothetical protein
LPAAIPGGQHQQGLSRPAGSLPLSDDMDLPSYACLLRDAARASAASWAEPMNQREHDRAVRHLSTALEHLQVVIARLAVRFRLGAVTQPEPARLVRAAAVTASTLAAGQAWLILDDILPAQADAPASGACVPADLLCFAARRGAMCWVPSTRLEEIAGHLAGALEALEDGTARLAASASRPLDAHLTAVRACLQAAGMQLRNGLPSAIPAAAAPGHRPGPLSRARACASSPRRRNHPC